jgi:RNA polymerase sigma-70 factor (ECF subfamily)
VRAARGGNRAAFGDLYARYQRMVHAVVLSRVAPAEADDIVQEVFLTAMRQLHSLREEGAFGGWLATIARNRAAAHYRSAPMETVELPEEIAGAATQEDEEEARRVLAVIRALPVAYRETLVMRLVEGMTGPEIAVRSGLTPDSVRVNLHRGMKLLRAELERKGGA